MNEKSVSYSSLGGSRLSPGLTLQSLSFKNFPKQIPKNNKKFQLKNIDLNLIKLKVMQTIFIIIQEEMKYYKKFC